MIFAIIGFIIGLSISFFLGKKLIKKPESAEITQQKENSLDVNNTEDSA